MNRLVCLKSLIRPTIRPKLFGQVLVNRCLHTSQSSLFYRPPRNSIYETGPVSKLWNRTPDSIKMISLIGISGYLFIFVAVPILTMVVPPLILGSIGFYKLNKWKRQKANNQRWEMIKDSTLVYNPKHQSGLLLPVDQINSELANFEFNRLIDAFWSNDDGLADMFKDTNIDDLALGSLDAVEFTYNSQSVLFAEDYKMMVIQQRPLYDKSKNKELASVIMSLEMLSDEAVNPLRMADPTLNISKSKVLIEVKPLGMFGKSVFIKTKSIYDNGNDNGDMDDSEPIEVEGKTRIL